MPCKGCHEDHDPLLRCEVAARQRMANDAWITPVVKLDNSKTYLYRDPERRRAQMREVMRRRRAKLKAAREMF